MFGFRLRFLSPPGSELETTELELTLPGAPDRLVLRQAPPRTNALPTDAVVFTVDGLGFAEPDEARQFGKALKWSLAIYSVRYRRGFDMGLDQITSALGSTVRERIRQDLGVDVRPIVHGLDVFDATIPMKRVECHARASVRRPIQDFPARLAAVFKNYELPPKLALAVELYNASSFEADSEVRFLSLVTVIEALASKHRHSDAVQKFLDSCVQLLDGLQLPPETDLDSLRSGLGNLRRESITRACLNLVAEAGADTELFRQAYKARSELLHNGVSTTYPELPRQPHRLDSVVQTVLLHQVGCVT